VSTGGARRGRRDNGLDAADFAAAGDVDPRVGEHLLDVLAIEGIAAYLQPSADQNPILRATTLPSRPTDRLYVDRTHLEDARATMHRLTGGAPPAAAAEDDRPGAGGTQSEIDAEWARIIAGFHTTAEPTWPAAESLDTARPAPQLPSAADITNITLDRRRTDPPPPPAEAFEDVEDSEDEERYIPPPPPPLPHISKYAIAGVLGIVVGFILFLRPSLLPIDRDFVTLIGFSAVIGGAVTLVWRLRSGDEDDDFDDGAVV
jgi:hypothetical protein